MKIKQTCLLLFAFIPLVAKSQTGLVIGYNIGSFRNAQRVPQAYAQSFNAQSGDRLVKAMKFNGFFRGITIGYKASDENWMFGIRWCTKKAESNTGENDVIIQKLRIRQNTLNLDFAFGSENIKIGASVDLGGIRVHSKYTNKVKNESTGWTKYYEGGALLKSGSIVTASTIFIDIKLGPKLEFRPFFQLPYSQSDILDDRTRKNYIYRTHNYGFSLCLVLFGDD